MTDQEINEFNTLFKNSCERLHGLLILGDYKRTNVGFFEKIKIKKSIRDFGKCLSMVPDHWQSMLFTGKAYQKLGDHQAALSFFEKALEVEHSDHSIPQEASLEANQLGDINKALNYSGEALRRSPGNFILMGNHAMNLLIAGRDNEAAGLIEEALGLQPDDPVNKNVQKLIAEVISGQKKRPTCKSVMGK
jgi:tetratricopeptide (TPR) repeat protein